MDAIRPSAPQAQAPSGILESTAQVPVPIPTAPQATYPMYLFSLFIKKSTITVLFKSNDVPDGEISCLWNPHGPEAGSQIRFLRRSRCLFPECL